MNVVPFNYNFNRKIIFRTGAVSELANEAAFYGRNLVLFTGGSSLEKSGNLAGIMDSLTGGGFSITHYSVGSEPSPELVDGIVSEISGGSVDVVVSVGGGSVIDAGKAVSAMLCEEGSVCDFLEGVGTKTPSGRKLPFIAVPTTAGTGSEATNNSVLSRVGENGFKKSLRHHNYTPDIAVIDPELYKSCPPRIAATSGMDALSQLIESYISTKASFFSDLHVTGAVEAVLEALPVVGSGKNDEDYSCDECDDAWNKMAYASYISGSALANCGLAIVHGMAGPAGGFFNAPHGALCGSLLAEGMKQTILKLEKEDSESPALLKFSKLGYIASGSDDLLPREARARFIQKLENLTDALSIPLLSDIGITEADLPKIAGASSNKNNPISFSTEEIISILKARL